MRSSSPSHVPPPPPQAQGGLYAGAPFEAGAPWATVPVTPDAGAMNLTHLATAAPPAMGAYHLPGGGLRPGNNTPLLPRAWTDGRVDDLGVVCIPGGLPRREPPPQGYMEQLDFRAHAYLPHARGRAWFPCRGCTASERV